MAKVMAMRDGAKSGRTSLAVTAATAAARGVSDARRPDLVTTAILAVLTEVILKALKAVS